MTGNSKPEKDGDFRGSLIRGSGRLVDASLFAGRAGPIAALLIPPPHWLETLPFAIHSPGCFRCALRTALISSSSLARNLETSFPAIGLGPPVMAPV